MYYIVSMCFIEDIFSHRHDAQGMPERCVLLDGCSKAFVRLRRAPAEMWLELGTEHWGYGEILVGYKSSNQESGIWKVGKLILH